MTLNLNTIQKNYDKLTAQERFALIVQAVTRDDEADRRALLGSAPRVHFSFPNTIGLAEGFKTLIHFYIGEQLGRAATFFMLIGFDDEKHTFNIHEGGKTYTAGDAIELCGQRFMEGMEAFNVICKEYNVDPQIVFYYCLYEHVFRFAELTIRAWYGADYSLALFPELESTIAGFREIIEDARKDWNEAQAK